MIDSKKLQQNFFNVSIAFFVLSFVFFLLSVSYGSSLMGTLCFIFFLIAVATFVLWSIEKSTDTPIKDTGNSGSNGPHKDNLLPEEFLLPDDYITSGDSKLILQKDGNLVLYKGISPLWSTKTDNKGGAKAIFQKDGNFVLYDSNGKALWAQGSVGLNKLILNSNGNLYMINDKGGTNYIYKA